jgi:hypothetical protein
MAGDIIGRNSNLHSGEMQMPNSSIAHVTQAVAKATGKKYCNDHQGEAALDAGCMVIRNKSRRWICFRCQEKRKNSQIHLAQKS